MTRFINYRPHDWPKGTLEQRCPKCNGFYMATQQKICRVCRDENGKAWRELTSEEKKSRYEEITKHEDI